MWQIYFFILLLLSCSSSRSTGISDCMESSQIECPNITGIDHLKCLISQQTTNIKQLLVLLKESQQHILGIRHKMKKEFGYNDTALEQLLDGENATLLKIPAVSTQSCFASAALNGTGVLVNPAVMALSTGPITSCRELPHTGQALLQLRDQSAPFWVFCVQQHPSMGSGWVVIQQRVFGKVDFFRSWMEYRDGFGNLDDEFWLGLENIHRMTRLQQYELLVEMTDFEGNYKFARYLRFEIGSEDESYVLRHLGSYSGTAGDSLRPHVGMKFSTYDNDNDHYDARNCALRYSSAWWFDTCFQKASNLNGLAVKSENDHSINWYGFSNKFQSLKYTRMMLRATK